MRCRCDARGVIFWFELHVIALFLFGQFLQVRAKNPPWPVRGQPSVPLLPYDVSLLEDMHLPDFGG